MPVNKFEAKYEMYRRRCDAYQVICDTIKELDSCQIEEIYDIIVKNFQRLTSADSVLLFSYDKENSTFSTVKECVKDGGSPIIKDHSNVIESCYECREVFRQSEIALCYPNAKYFKSLFTEVLFDEYLDKQYTYYRFSCLSEGRILAIGLLVFANNCKLVMEDIFNTYLCLVSATLSHMQTIELLKGKERQLEEQKERTDSLLRFILPDIAVEELREKNKVQLRHRDGVAVLFCDIVAFTRYCSSHSIDEVIDNLQVLVESYESLVIKYDAEKIKTVGDAFMCVAGLLKQVQNPVQQCIKCGIDMIKIASTLKAKWKVRVGIHVGPVAAGILGHRQYLFDVWGDTVNFAARCEQAASPNNIVVSRQAKEMAEDLYEFESLGLVQIKGKGELELFRVKVEEEEGFNLF